MSTTRRRGKSSVLVIAAAALLTTFRASPADDKPVDARQNRAPAPVKISGLIMEVDKYLASSQTAGKSEGEHWVVNVNTDVPWIDFVRDQAVSPDEAAKTSPEKAAAKGRKSVASEGQPISRDLIASASLDARTKLMMRYRSSTDEATKGAATPADAAKTAAAVDSAPPSNGAKQPTLTRTAAKPRPITTKDLKPGLWVEIELRPDDPKHAETLTVLQPIEDVKVPSEPAKPASPRR
jgi:hypothetical protein